jgi:imidazolonepropionase-like amidohydrolase
LAIGLVLAIAACSGRTPPTVTQAPPPIARPTPPPATEKAAAFVGVTVVPMDRERVIADQTVLVEHGIITAVGPTGSVKVPPDALFIVGQGKFLMPGLADMHTHLDSASALPLLVANGVTVVRNMWGTPRTLRWRKQIESGERLGPTIYTAGPVVDGDPPFWNGSTTIDDAAGAERVVAEQQRAGYDFVKIYNNLTLPEYDALVAAARRHAIPLAGHVPTHVPLGHALAAGQLSVEHLTGYLVALQKESSPFFGTTGLPHRRHVAEHVDRAKIPAVIEATRAAGTWSCVTLTVDQWFVPDEEIAKLAARPEMRYVPPWLRAAWDPRLDPPPRAPVAPVEYQKNAQAERLLMDLTRELARATGKVVVGTDSPNAYVVPGFAVHKELANLVAAGLTPYEALTAATRAPAELLHASDSIGTVAVGKRADLILTDGNPLADVGNAQKIAGVMVRGRWLPADDLHALLERLAASYAPPADRFAGMVALPDEGAPEWTGRFTVGMRRVAFGEERAAIERGAGGARILHVQSVTDEPDPSRETLRIELGTAWRGEKLTMEIERPDGKSTISLTRKDGHLRGEGSTPYQSSLTIDHPIAEDAILAGPLASTHLLLAERLGKLRPGQSETLRAVRLDPDMTLVDVAYQIERLAGAGNKYKVVARSGRSHQTLHLEVDTHNMPTLLTADERGGTVEYRREK